MNLTFQVMQVLNEQEMQQIWEAALRVWGQVPLRAQGTEEFNEALHERVWVKKNLIRVARSKNL